MGEYYKQVIDKSQYEKIDKKERKKVYYIQKCKSEHEDSQKDT
jgi:hypothetical protein